MPGGVSGRGIQQRGDASCSGRARTLRRPAARPIGGCWASWMQRALPAETLLRLQAFELQAVEHADLYEDVRFCARGAEIARRRRMPGLLAVAAGRGALHRAPCARRSDRGLGHAATRPAGSWGSRCAPPSAQAGLEPAHVMALADTAPALDMTKRLGLNAMLMINDYDEGRALAERNPAGAIVSLAELPRRAAADRAALRHARRHRARRSHRSSCSIRAELRGLQPVTRQPGARVPCPAAAPVRGSRACACRPPPRRAPCSR